MIGMWWTEHLGGGLIEEEKPFADWGCVSRNLLFFQLGFRNSFPFLEVNVDGKITDELLR